MEISMDKVKHFYYSFLIIMLLTVFCSIDVAIIITAFICILKELYDLVKDHLNNRKLRIKDCIYDLIADSFGAGLWLLIYYLMKGGL